MFVVTFLLLLTQFGCESHIVWVEPGASFCNPACGSSLLKCSSIHCGLKVAQSNDTILISSGYYSGPGNVGLSSQNFTDLTGLHFEGEGVGSTEVSCEGSDNSVWLHTSDKFVTKVSDLKVTNCRGIIALNSSITVSDMIFSNHSSVSNGTGILSIGSGGRTRLVITRCAFFGLVASAGSAVTVIGPVSLIATSSNFTHNGILPSGAPKTTSGGAVWMTGLADGIFDDCLFVGNGAQVNGGAITVTVEGQLDATSNFGNQASLFEAVRREVLFKNTRFYRNRIVSGETCPGSTECDALGGAVYSETHGRFKFISCDFEENVVYSSALSGGRGGAVYATRAFGTAIQDALIEMEGCTFTSNSVFTTSSSTSVCVGGAIYANYVVLMLTYTTLTSNNVNVQPTTLEQDIFTVNPFLGGAIGTLHVFFEMTSCTLQGNVAGMGGSGGALWLETGSTANITLTTFDSNIVSSSFDASGQGGAIASLGGVFLRIGQSRFIGNGAKVCSSAPIGSSPSARKQRQDAQQCMSGSGGALYMQGTNVVVENTVFLQNMVDSGGHDSGANGGALSVVDSSKYEVSFVGCSFLQNRAGGGTTGIGSFGGSSNAGSGGAVFAIASVLDFMSTLFRENTALGTVGEFSYGGAVSIKNFATEPSQFSNCTFVANRACPRVCPNMTTQFSMDFDQGGRGGALAIESASATVKGSSFSYNKVYSSYSKTGLGGAAYLSTSGQLLVSNSTFQWNSVVPHTNEKLQWVDNSYEKESDFKHLAIGSQITASSFPYSLVNLTLTDGCLFEPSCFVAQGLTAPPDKNSIIAEIIHVVEEFFPHQVQCWDIAGLGANVKIRDMSPRSNRTHILIVSPPAKTVEISDELNGMDPKDLPMSTLEIDAAAPPGLSIWAFAGRVDIAAGNGGSTAQIENIYLVNSTIHTDVDISVLNELVASGTKFSASAKLTGNCAVRYDTEWVTQNDSQSPSCPIIAANRFIELGMVESWVYLALLLDVLPTLFNDISQYFNNPTNPNEYQIGEHFHSDEARILVELAVNSLATLFNSNKRKMELDSVTLVIRNDFEYLADLGPGIVHNNALNDPLRLQLEISCERIELTNAWFVVAKDAAVFAFPTTLTFHMHDKQSLFLLEGDLWLEKYTSVSDQLSGAVQCKTDITDDDDGEDGSFTLNGTSYSLMINGSAVQAPGSEFHIESLDHTHRYMPYIYVLNATHWEGALNLAHAVPLGSVNLVSGKSGTPDVSSKYEIVEFGELVGNTTNITVISLNTMKISWHVETSVESGIRGSSSIDELTCGGRLQYSSMPRNLKMNNVHLTTAATNILNCSSCKIDSRCEYCSVYSSSDSTYGCYEKGNRTCANSKFEASCCDHNCGEHHLLLGFITFKRGHCQRTKNYWYLHECRCNTWFYEGYGCENFSNSGIVIIVFGCIIPVFILFLAFGLYFKRTLEDVQATHLEELENQEANTLAELRERLLNTGDGDEMRRVGVDKREQVKQSFLQDLTEKLVLQDVLVPFEQLTLEKHIGEGAMGVVYRARFRSARVAVKLIKTPEFMEMDEEELERFRAEAYLMSRLRHPNLVLIMGVTQYIAEKHVIPQGANGIMPGFKVGDKTIGIISEYLNRGSLDSVLYGERAQMQQRESQDLSVQSDQKFPVASWSHDNAETDNKKSRSYSIDSMDSQTTWSYEIILSCALQAARGVLFLHSQLPPIVHRDLKCSNLVIDDKFVVKITDFGMSRLLPNHITEERAAESVYSRASTSNHSSSYHSMSQHSSHYSSVHSAGPISDLESGSESFPFSDATSLLPGIPVSTASTEPSLTTRLDSEDKPLPYQPPTPEMTYMGPAKRTYVEDGGGVEMTSNVGTVAWAAPEIFAGENIASYSLACDAYSFGMVMYELAERRAPFDHLNSRFDIMDIVLQGGRPEIVSSLLLEEQPAFRALMERCWSQRPDMRPTFFEIVETLEEMYASERSANKQLESVARRASQERQRSMSSAAKKVLFKLPSSPVYEDASAGDDMDDPKFEDYVSDETKPSVGRFGFRLGLFPKRGSREELISPRSRQSF